MKLEMEEERKKNVTGLRKGEDSINTVEDHEIPGTYNLSVRLYYILIIDRMFSGHLIQKAVSN